FFFNHLSPSEIYPLSLHDALPICNFWLKVRFGAIEVMGGYQRFNRTAGQGGSLFVYPLTANVVVRAPDALFRPYASVGGGLYGRSEEHTSELQSRSDLVCRLLLEK